MNASFDRRRFLRVVAGSVIVLPVGRFLVACGEDDSYEQTGTNPPAAAPRADGSNVVYSSSSTEGHFHTFSIAMAALASPPAGGMDGNTSAADGHLHAVSVSMAQLASVAAGQTVQVPTGSADGHSHVLTFVKLSASGNGPDGGSSSGNGDGGERDPYGY